MLIVESRISLNVSLESPEYLVNVMFILASKISNLGMIV